MPLEEWELPDDVSDTLSKYRSRITECRKKVEMERNVVTSRGPTYLQSRAQKSIEFHDKALQSLDSFYDEKKEKQEEALEILQKEFDEKKDKLEKALEILQKGFDEKKEKLEKSLESLEVEKNKTRLEHEEAIEKAKDCLEYKSVPLIRAEAALEEAIVAKNKYFESVTKTSEPERKAGGGHTHTHTTPYQKKERVCVSLPEYKTPIIPIVAPEEKIFLWEGEQVSEWEYKLRVSKFGEGHTHTHTASDQKERVCVSPTPPPPAKSKKPLKIAKKIVGNSTEIFSTTPAEQNEPTTSESIPTDGS